MLGVPGGNLQSRDWLGVVCAMWVQCVQRRGQLFVCVQRWLRGIGLWWVRGLRGRQVQSDSQQRRMHAVPSGILLESVWSWGVHSMCGGHDAGNAGGDSKEHVLDV